MIVCVNKESIYSLFGVDDFVSLETALDNIAPSLLDYHFKDFCDKANNDAETIFVTRKSGGNIVLLSEANYNNLMENLYIRSNKANYVKLMESIQQLNQGKVSERILMDD